MCDKNSEICSCSDAEVKLIFACSGGADVGALSDLVARKMMKDGCGKMFCLAGIGGQVQGIIKTTEDANKLLVIDGCPVKCAKKTMDQAGITGYQHFCVTDMGFDKGSSPALEESIEKLAAHGKGLIG